MMRLSLSLMLFAGCAALPDSPSQTSTVSSCRLKTNIVHILVFTKTAEYRHESIEAGVKAIREISDDYGLTVSHSEDSTTFNSDALSLIDVVVFLNTTGDILSDQQQKALEVFVQNGGGYVGVHSATDTEYDWSWYGELVGAYFNGHPKIQSAGVTLMDPSHISCGHLPRRWQRTDEWYNFRDVSADVHVLLTLDTNSFEGSTMDGCHPIAWCHEFDGGRSWYTGGGHTKESFAEPLFRRHLLGGILWAAGIDELPETIE